MKEPVLSVLGAYHDAIVKGGVVFDVNQENIIHHFDEFKSILQHRLLAENRCRSSVNQSFFKYFLGEKKRALSVSAKGIYLWGGVGRGKTFIMDLFFHALPFAQKKRFHYHHLMQRIHEELKIEQGEKDPLEKVVNKIAKEAHILCIDEFFVTDIGDAMILSSFLAAIFSRGVALVITSNLHPADLYKGGLQRQLFLPAINLLELNLKVVSFDHGMDYRLRALDDASVFFAAGVDAETSMNTIFNQMLFDGSTQEVSSDKAFVINEREIICLRRGVNIVWFSFRELCGGFRSQLDYVEIAKKYQAVFINDIPILTASDDDQARRFVYLIDALYDYNVKLVASFHSSVMNIYDGYHLTFEFQRAVSRLTEMKAEYYLSRQHRNILD